MAYKIVIDAGHGGVDPGATYGNRTEKDDNLSLAMLVGRLLRDDGYDVEYTRTTDVYDTPFEKATKANNANADLFISFHRNSTLNPNTSSGIETLVYNKQGIKYTLAENINKNLSALGFQNRGVIERPNLVVLKRTKMPAVLIESGFINNDSDNALYDSKKNEIAYAIAAAVNETLGNSISTGGGVGGNTGVNSDSPVLYKVQVGAFSNSDNAYNLANKLDNDGFPSYVNYVDNLYKVYVGAYENLQNAVNTEISLRRAGYQTYITTV